MDVSLALGGGGVKGFAHIGVLRVLEHQGFNIRAIAGTSIGGLIGAVYAAGYTPDEIQSILTALDQHRFYLRRPGDGPAMLGLAGIADALAETLGERTFEDVHIPFTVTAVDINSGELLALQRGRLIDAILATIAVPGVFPPCQWDGRTLIDGGVLDPIPVALARSLAPDAAVAAVVLSPPFREWSAEGKTPRLLDSLPFLVRYLGRLRIAQAFNIFLRSVDIAGSLLTDLRLEIDHPDVIIRPKTHEFGLIDIVDVAHLTHLGEQATRERIPQLQRVTRLPGRLSRRLRGWVQPSPDRYHHVA